MQRKGAPDRRLAVVLGCLSVAVTAAAISAMIAFHAGLDIPWLFLAYSLGGGFFFLVAVAVASFLQTVGRHMDQDYARNRRP